MAMPSMETVQARNLARTETGLCKGVKRVIPPIEWPVLADDIDAILTLKRTAQRRDPGA